MYEEVRIPKKLGTDTIVEAILDIRISDRVSEKVIAEKLGEFLGIGPKKTEMVNIPDTVRESDFQLRFTPGYLFRRDNFTVGVGLHNLFFDFLKPYSGWDKSYSKILDVIKFLNEQTTVKNNKISQVVLRYIDVLDKDITDCCNISLTIGGREVSKKFSYHTEIKERNHDVHLIIESNQKRPQTRVDIGVAKVFNNVEVANFETEIKKYLDEEHLISKQFFFGVLRHDFLDSLNPEY